MPYNMLHSSGLINLSGSCADIDFDGDGWGISDEMDDDMIGVFDECELLLDNLDAQQLKIDVR
jgi:hypothetical protein